MKRAAIILTIIFGSLSASGQIFNKAATNNAWNRVKADSAMYAPLDTFQVRPATQLGQPVGDSGRIAYKNNRLWYRDLTSWKEITTGSASGFVPTGRTISITSSTSDLTVTGPTQDLSANRTYILNNGSNLQSVTSRDSVTLTGMIVGDNLPNRNPVPGDPPHKFEVVTEGAGHYLALFQNYSNTAGLSNFHMAKFRGTKTSPLAVLNNDFLGSWGFRGYGGVSLAPSSGAFTVQASEDFTSSRHGTRVNVETTAIGANANLGRTWRWTFGDDGYLYAPYTSVTNSMYVGALVNIGIPFSVSKSTTAGSSNVYLSNTNNTSGVYNLISNIQNTSSSSFVFNATVAGIDKFVVKGDGNVGVGTSTPTSTMHVAGSFATAITTVTGTSTLDATHHTVNVNNSANVTINLPAASGCPGRIYFIKKISNNAFTVSIDPNGSENIEGSSTPQVLGAYLNSFTIQSDGTGWWIY